ncbi:VPS33, partial [Symbiodinium microadriaticum]
LGDFVSDTGRDIPDHIVYLTRPTIAHMKSIARQVQGCMKAGIRSQYHVYFMPHRSVACEQMLEDEGVLEVINIGEYHLGLIPFDSDLLSLEMVDLFRQCYVDGDSSPLCSVARALDKVQALYGVIPNIKSKGAASRKVLQKLLHLRREREGVDSRTADAGATMSGGDADPPWSRVDTLVLIDREVDLFSALLTPLTYEGLIDEFLGIENGRVKIDASLLSDEKDQLSIPSIPGVSQQPIREVASAEPRRAPGDKVFLPLSNVDVVYSEIRNLSIEALGPFLQ